MTFYKLTTEEHIRFCKELKPAELCLLYYIKTIHPFGSTETANIKIRETAKLLGVQPSTVSRALKKLQDGGYLDLEIIEASVKLTPKGLTAAQKEEVLRTDNTKEEALRTDNTLDANCCVQTTSVAYRQQVLRTDNTAINNDRAREDLKIKERSFLKGTGGKNDSHDEWNSSARCESSFDRPKGFEYPWISGVKSVRRNIYEYLDEFVVFVQHKLTRSDHYKVDGGAGYGDAEKWLAVANYESAKGNERAAEAWAYWKEFASGEESKVQAEKARLNRKAGSSAFDFLIDAAS